MRAITLAPPDPKPAPPPAPVVVTAEEIDAVSVPRALRVLDQLIHERETHAAARHLAQSARARDELVTLLAVRVLVASRMEE